jgi:hypothetical protein
MTQRLACLLGLVFFGLYALAVSQISNRPSKSPAPELVTTLPVAAQVLFAGGDRYLAANLSGFRVLVASTARMGADDYRVQGRLQKDIAWLNPAHEDNYYIAAAILPWAGEVDAAQEVLQRAGKKRSFDWMPLFYYGFGRYYFFKDPVSASKALLEASPRAREQQDQWSLQILAAKWAERGYSTANAAGFVSAMAETSPPGAFRKYLQHRAARLHDLARLREAAGLYEARYGRKLSALAELENSGILKPLPVDPLGIGYDIAPSGQPVFRETL